MIGMLIHRFIPDSSDTDSPKIRYAVCQLLGYVGIFLNTALAASKYIIGISAGSVAIKGDAVNNLTDSLSNVISILTFHLAEKPADKEHPYGHERTETIAALFMGMVIIYLGIEMLRQSVEKILHPQAYHFEWAAVAVLVISIAVKLYMYAYNHKFALIYNSDLLEANAIDSRNDIWGTALILVSTLVSPLIHYDLDGIVGVIVAGIILYSAYGLLKDVINTLLGEAPDIDTVNSIVDLYMSSPIVIDVHDVAVHSYGPKYKYATAHVEVDGNENLMDVHAMVDGLERQIMKDMNIEMVTHVDPVLLHDAKTNETEDIFGAAAAALNPAWALQDFRIEDEPSGKERVYFDLIVPYEEHRSEEELTRLILQQTARADQYELVMRIVHPFS